MDEMGGRGASAGEIELLYRARYRAFVRGTTALLRDGEAAYDVVQEAFARALSRRRTFRGEGTVEAWLWRIVLNGVRDRRRSDVRAPATSFAAVAESRGGEADELRAAILALPERQRTAVFLRYYADLSYAQIADVLGVKPGTVAASLHAAHRSLRRDLEEVAR